MWPNWWHWWHYNLRIRCGQSYRECWWDPHTKHTPCEWNGCCCGVPSTLPVLVAKGEVALLGNGRGRGNGNDGGRGGGTPLVLFTLSEDGAITSCPVKWCCTTWVKSNGWVDVNGDDGVNGTNGIWERYGNFYCDWVADGDDNGSDDGAAVSEEESEKEDEVAAVVPPAPAADGVPLLVILLLYTLLLLL